jgi:hypothetical protein
MIRQGFLLPRVPIAQVVLLVCACVPQALAQQLDFARLDAYVQKSMDEWQVKAHAPGIALDVFLDEPAPCV